MMIRSQDKMKIVNLSNEKQLGIYGAFGSNDGFIYTSDTKKADSWRIESPSMLLGEYSTKEKALKVLDMIEHQCAVGNPTYSMPADEKVEED